MLRNLTPRACELCEHSRFGQRWTDFVIGVKLFMLVMFLSSWSALGKQGKTHGCNTLRGSMKEAPLFCFFPPPVLKSWAILIHTPSHGSQSVTDLSRKVTEESFPWVSARAEVDLWFIWHRSWQIRADQCSTFGNPVIPLAKRNSQTTVWWRSCGCKSRKEGKTSPLKI